MGLRSLLTGLGLLLLAGSASASDEGPIYRCVTEGYVQDIRIVDGEWYSRNREKPEWRAQGCREGRSAYEPDTEVACSFDGGRITVRNTRRYPEGMTTMREQRFDLAGKRYVTFWGRPTAAEERGVACEAWVDDGKTVAPDQRWPLSRKIAEGKAFIFVTEREHVRLQEGDWTWPTGRWVSFEGRYHAEKGLWAVSGVGFTPRGNPLHACPAGQQCGGIHEAGGVLDRWYKPEDGELVVMGLKFRFDEAGNVFDGDRRIGLLIVPEF